jgi:hypothetical protein
LRVRKLDENGDRVFGHSQGDFLVNSPEGVAQCVLTRLKLYVGDWFLNTSDGTPWYTRVFGKRTESVRDAVIKARILGTPGVTGIVSYSSQVSRDLRHFSVQCQVLTAYDSDQTQAAALSVNIANPFFDARLSR